MAFERYHYPADYLDAKTQEMGGGDLQAFTTRAVAVLIRRLRQNPAGYVDYGPYWWALKEVLIQHGEALGGQRAPLIRAAYSGPTPAHIIVAADLFRRHAQETWPEGSRNFDLHEDSAPYVLEDPDMEALVI